VRPLVVEVRIVLPGEGDAAVELDGVARHLDISAADVGLRASTPNAITTPSAVAPSANSPRSGLSDLVWTVTP
jgi:hypothetical protein